MKIALPRRDRVDGMEITLPRATETRWNWNLCLRSRRCCVALIYVDINSTASENETFPKQWVLFLDRLIYFICFSLNKICHRKEEDEKGKRLKKILNLGGCLYISCIALRDGIKRCLYLFILIVAIVWIIRVLIASSIFIRNFT